MDFTKIFRNKKEKIGMKDKRAEFLLNFNLQTNL